MASRSQWAFGKTAPAGDVDEAGQLYKERKGMKIEKAILKIDGNEIEKGSHQLEEVLIDNNGEMRSAYYVNIN